MGQTAPLEQTDVPVSVDSGLIVNRAVAAGASFSTVLRVPGAAWLRLIFDEATLGAAPPRRQETHLRLTSLADGAIQVHDRATLDLWRGTSAYFNGDAVRVELFADPQAEASRIVITHVLAGPPAPDGGTASICGPDDDRVPSNDPRAARTVPGGCTAWMISDAAACFLTAGHCVAPGLDLVEFNVPLSPGGVIQHPGPEDQYMVDTDSIQFFDGGVGDDWCYFGCFANSETGMTAFGAQGTAYALASAAPAVAGQTIRITGYGVDASPPEWNQIQQTHGGPYVDMNGTALSYQVDTEGGNSGSAVLDEDTALAIGIHTHGGCNPGDTGANSGTAINHPGLQGALAIPQGVCLPVPLLSFSFPDGLPEAIDPATDVIRVDVAGANGATPQPGTGRLHVDAGGGFIWVDMIEVGPNVYDAAFPVIPCGTIVDYYFSAETTAGDSVREPLLAPFVDYSILTADQATAPLDDDFESDLGWTVTNAGGLTDGPWERAVPVPHILCNRGNPNADADGSGQCFLTDNNQSNCNSDVDNGSTTLTSPIVDASGGMAIIRYWRWYSNSYSTNPFEDVFVVEISDDAGQTWTELETVGPTGPAVSGGWFRKSFLLQDFVPATNELQIRFTASDLINASVVEAAVDGVSVTTFTCPESPPGDIDGDGSVGVFDLLRLLGEWGPCAAPCPPACTEDLDGDCIVGSSDLLIVLSNWTI